MAVLIGVNGANGKMGREVIKYFKTLKGFKIVGEWDKEDDFEKELKKAKPDIVIDFTASSAGFENAKKIIKAGIRPVIGTTGFSLTQIKLLKKLCAKKKLGGIVAPNFSLSAILLMQFAKQAARYFPHAEIIELHHENKEEAPSGTAIRTADFIREGRKEKIKLKKSRDIIPHARGANYHDIAIHSVRLPGLVAHEMVMFGGVGESLVIKQDSMTRECFMAGIKLACEKVLNLNELIYGLEKFLD